MHSGDRSGFLLAYTNFSGDTGHCLQDYTYICTARAFSRLTVYTLLLIMNSGGAYYREFEDLFRKNYSRLFFYALDWVEDEEAAKDIVSDTFGDVWADYGRLRGATVAGYMVRMVRNRSINYIRHRQVTQNYRDRVIRDKTAAFDDDLDTQEENLRVIDNVLKTLTPQTRVIFEECYFDGRTYREQAEHMGISVSAVNKHMNKAFAAFRAAFVKKREKGARGMIYLLLNLLL